MVNIDSVKTESRCKKHFTGSGWLTEKAATVFSSENNPVNLSSASHKGYWLWNILLITLARKKN